MKTRVRAYTSLVFGTLFLYFGFLMRFDPDIHHDGIMFTPAVAFSEGLLPNRDAFAYYGPGSPIIQGLAVQVFGANVYSIRLLGAAVFALSFSIVFYMLTSMISKRWALIFIFLGAIPAASILPWSTAFTTLSSLLCILILNNSFSRHDYRLLNYKVLAASVLISLSFYIRIHQIFVSVSVLAFFILVKKDRRQAFSWVVGFFLGHILVLTLMYVNGMAKGFLLDCIVYPQSVAIIRDFEIAYFVGLLWYPVLTISTFGYIYIITKFYKRNFLNILFMSFISIALGFLAYKISHVARTGWITYRNPKIIAIDGAWLSNVLIGYFSATILLVLFFKLCTDKVLRDNSRISLGICVALGVLPQLYPMYDRMHLWLITPVLMLPVLQYLATSALWSYRIQSSTKFFATSLLTLQILTIGNFVNIDRVPFQSPALIHMLGTAESSMRIDPSVMMLFKFRNEKFLFDCNNAFYAAANQTYQSSSKFYVNWGNISNQRPEITSNYKFICNMTKKVFLSYQKAGKVVDFRVLEYFESEGKIQRYNVIVLETHDNF